VYAQGEPSSRANPIDLEKWHARNQDGQMVPFSAFASGRWIQGAPKLARFNGVESVKFTAIPLPGVSTGDAMKVVEDIVENQLPQGVGLSYTGISYEERQAGSQTGRLYALAMIVVFLCLAALYESWSVPIAIAMVVPFGALGAIFATLNSGLSNDVFFQIGLLTVMGLSAKNAILIVEFAKQMVEKENIPLLKAAVIASKLRLRPIIMTSMAFALGVLPMVKAHGASAVSQQSLGTCVLGGTLAATFLAIFFVPLFYVFVVGIFNRKLLYPPKNKTNDSADASAA
jgi:multidrug efflux pump